jgi:hypothetical protein
MSCTSTPMLVSPLGAVPSMHNWQWVCRRACMCEWNTSLDIICASYVGNVNELSPHVSALPKLVWFVWGRTHKFWWRVFNHLAFCYTWMSPTAKRGRVSCLKHPRKIWEHFGPLSYSFYSLSSPKYMMQLLQHTPFLFKLFSLELRTKFYFIFYIQ